MSRVIDHDEEDRDSSEYEVCDEEEEEEEDVREETGFVEAVKGNYGKTQPPFPEHILEHQESTSGSHEAVELPVSMKIEYEEVYPHQVDHQNDINEAGKVYYENEMEDLVYHEIYGEGSEQQKLGHDKRIRNLLGNNVSCLICQRTESEKIRLFKWPKSQELREQWLHFFRIPLNMLNAVAEPYICCFHFSADTFVMMEDRIFWKQTALPKYRHRRPVLSEPFPWEPSAKLKLDDHVLNAQSSSTDSIGYKIRYRMPYNKHKSRRAHQVAVMIPIAQPHLYYEFHFNRHGLNNTKFYACLNCRKAKSESGIRDVIRTIHLDGNKFLSNGDPFNGHHFACRPHNVYDNKSSWRPIPSQNGEAQFLDEVVYVDESGNSLEWDNVTRPEPRGGKFAVGPPKETPPQGELYENFTEPVCEEIIGTSFAIEEPPVENMDFTPSVIEEEDKSTASESQQKEKPRIKCHLCSKSGFPSTKNFISHLQKHIAGEKQCKKCSQKISCDSRPICIRRGVCENCSAH